MYAVSTRFICYLTKTSSEYKHLFAAKEPHNSKTVLAVGSPLKANTIEKYFLLEKDIKTIKGSLLENPYTFEFDLSLSSQK